MPLNVASAASDAVAVLWGRGVVDGLWVGRGVPVVGARVGLPEVIYTQEMVLEYYWHGRRLGLSVSTVLSCHYHRFLPQKD
jgi:hypothetical protein